MPTVTLRPNANGDIQEFTSQFPASGSHWDKVDEATADDDTTYIERSTSGSGSKTDIFQLENVSPYVFSISNIEVYARVINLSDTLQTINFKIKTGGTVYTSTVQNASSLSYVVILYSWATNPQTGVAWTTADINSLQAGLNLSGSIGLGGRCTQLYVIVTYADESYAIDPLTRVSGIRWMFDASIGKIPDYYMEILLGGVTTAYAPTIGSSKPVPAVSPQTAPSGAYQSDYESYLKRTDIDTILRTFGKFPSYGDWLNRFKAVLLERYYERR